MKVFNKTQTGFNHTKINKVCQDYSFSYSVNGKNIIICADGHGGKIYIRSDKGSMFATTAAFKVFVKLAKNKICTDISDDFKEKLKLELLCEYNHLVEKDYGEHPFTKDELIGLDDDKIRLLYDNPAIAYGSTLHAALIVNNLVLTISIGDGGIFLVNDHSLKEISDDSDDNVANITNSLCDDNAYKYINVNVNNIDDYDVVMCCTDGVVNPYQSLTNFEQSFAHPLLEKLKEENGVYYIRNFIKKLGEEKGTGDDVSLALYCK